MSDSSDVEKCKEERMTNYERYYETVLLTIGLRHHLNNYAKTCRFLSAEPIFHDADGNEITPDIVFQYSQQLEGALCEVKASLPFPDGYLLEKLKRLEKYSKPAVGWDTPDKTVKNHDILLFCHSLDIDRVLPKLLKWLQDGSLTVSRKLCVCEWSMISSTKRGKDVILVRHSYGDTDNEELNGFLHDNIVIDVQKLAVDIENCKFTRKEPPVEYTMVELWMNIFQAINSTFEDFEASIEDLLKVTYDYYIPWSNIGNEYSQVRESWIKKAMTTFCNIKLAEQVPNKKGVYQVFRSKQIPKLVLNFFAESLCNQLLKDETKKPQIADDGLKNQKSLEGFLPK